MVEYLFDIFITWLACPIELLPTQCAHPLDKTGLGGGAKGEQDGGAAQAEDPYLVVHPNFVADEGFWVCEPSWVFVSLV